LEWLKLVGPQIFKNSIKKMFKVINFFFVDRNVCWGFFKNARILKKEKKMKKKN